MQLGVFDSWKCLIHSDLWSLLTICDLENSAGSERLIAMLGHTRQRRLALQTSWASEQKDGSQLETSRKSGEGVSQHGVVGDLLEMQDACSGI